MRSSLDMSFFGSNNFSEDEKIKPRSDYLSDEQMQEALNLYNEIGRLWGDESLKTANSVNFLINDSPDGRVHEVINFLNIRLKKAQEINEGIEAVLDITLLNENPDNKESLSQILREKMFPALRAFVFMKREEGAGIQTNTLRKLFHNHKKALTKLIGDVQGSSHWNDADRMGVAINYADVPLTCAAYKDGFSHALARIDDMSTYYHARPEDFIARMRADVTFAVDFDFAERVQSLRAEELRRNDKPVPVVPEEKAIKMPPIADLLAMADEKYAVLNDRIECTKKDNQVLAEAIENFKAQASTLRTTCIENIDILAVYIADFKSRPIKLRQSFYEQFSYTREDLTTHPETPELADRNSANVYDVAQRDVNLVVSDLMRRISNALEVIAEIDDEDLTIQAASLVEKSALLQVAADEFVLLKAENLNLGSNQEAYSEWVDKLGYALTDIDQRMSWHSVSEEIMNDIR